MSQTHNNPLKQEKLNKKSELIRQGVNPYPHSWNKPRTNSKQMILDFKNKSEDDLKTKVYYIAGRLMRKRDMGKAAFFNIQDSEGELQCYIRKDAFSDKTISPDAIKPVNNTSQTQKTLHSWDLWKLCDIGDIIGLSGHLFKTKKGELSLKITNLQILCKSLEVLPEKYHGLEDKEIKYRYRHLDLIMDKNSRQVFKTRSKILQEIRCFMHQQDFMEVETPVLQSIYGGAVAQPFETYFRRLQQKMYLKISPELYLKKLVVGGFEKVFEIGKNFRNEGIDRSHNPEFTMMEYYSAYTDYQDQMIFFEKLITHVTQKIKNSLQFTYLGKDLDMRGPWIQISPQEFENLLCARLVASNTTNTSSKTSIAFQYKNKTCTPLEFFADINLDLQKQKEAQTNLDFSSFWAAYSKNSNSKETAQDINTERNRYQLLLSYIQHIQPTTNLEVFLKFLQSEDSKSLVHIMRVKKELSLLALECSIETYFWNPVFIKDFPLDTSPLTKVHRQNPLLVERFEPYIAGMELGNAYTELNDPVEQRQRLQKQKRYDTTQAKPLKNSLETLEKTKSSQLQDVTDNEAIDENFLHALEVGMPPTGGVGLGIERLVMILTNQSHIKDSMLFPMLKNSK